MSMANQLSVSKVDEGEYDYFIEGLIKQKFSDDEVEKQMMNFTKGHENPFIVRHRIVEIRKKL